MIRTFKFLFLFSLWSALCAATTADSRVNCTTVLEGLTAKTDRFRYTPRLKIPTIIRGNDENSFRPSTPLQTPVHELREYDTIVVGGGIAGLTSGVYLTDANQKVLLLEKEPVLGGLAVSGERAGMRYARGGAYLSAPDLKEYKIFQHIGLKDYQKTLTIHEPIDSLLMNDEFYPGVWEKDSLEKLPRSFALFKYALEKLNRRIPIQPIEDSGLLEWDHLTAAQWIQRLPAYVASLTDAKSRRIYEEFLQDSRINHDDPMIDVMKFVNLFSRSALGWELNSVSATAFANFYISEISPRYTGNYGTGEISQRLVDILNERSQMTMRTESSVSRITNRPDGVEVTYLLNGVAHKVRAKRLIFSAQLGLAPRLISDFERLAPQHNTILADLEYANYSVHNVFVEGHPWRETYDLWTYRNGYSERDPTDIILGRWQNEEIAGYLGMRNFERNPNDNTSILTIYHPLPRGNAGSGFTNEQALEWVDTGVEYTLATLGPLLKKRWGTEIKIKFVETNRWPYSIHIVKPGWLSKMKVLREPVGNIYFGNNNLGLPSVEEALYRGARAAREVLDGLRPLESENLSRVSP